MLIILSYVYLTSLLRNCFGPITIATKRILQSYFTILVGIIFVQILAENSNQTSFSDMNSKKCKYDEPYTEYGFTSVIVGGVKRPQCVLCNKVLGNNSIRPAKLKQHLQNLHPQSKEKDKSYFEGRSKTLKTLRLDASSEFFKRNSKIVKALYEVALKIAK